MATTTPFVKRMRTQGGTIYTFSSALEDIGLNINERNNIVKMSHYALLNIPSIDAPVNIQQNKFNVFAIPGAYESFLNSASIKDGRVIVAESFQNYALNLETNLLSQSTYNPSLQTTVSERVFWKWLKETGSIRWAPVNTSIGTYWHEETDSDTSLGYNSIVKCIGQISAGSVRTDTFGTYNETYVLVPTSYGQTPVYFKQVDDDNYKHGLAITNGYRNILGRENYLQPHPDVLDMQAYYDLADSSTSILATPSVTLKYDNSTGVYSNGWWWTYEAAYGGFFKADGTPVGIADDNSYYIDSSRYISEKIYNIKLNYDESNIEFLRSKVDCMSIEFDLAQLKNMAVWGNPPTIDSTLTFDKIAIEYAIDDQFDFNAILLYYSVYNKAADVVLATNLLGVLFLDPPSGNTSAYPNGDILMPSISKLQSGPSGFGTSYSFRLNIKSDYMLDDTAASIYDESTSAQTALSNWTDVFDNLGRTLAILNQQTGTLTYITEQYLDITANQTNIENQITQLSNTINTLGGAITGDDNAISMFSSGAESLVESSIYMKNGQIGLFTPAPSYPVDINANTKVKELIIENAIRDVSGNILLGYGSPLQLGSSTNYREINMYTGNASYGFKIDTSNNVYLGSISNASTGYSLYYDPATKKMTYGIAGSGSGSVSGGGTTGTIPIFTAGTAIGNSAITDSGSLVTIARNTKISKSTLPSLTIDGVASIESIILSDAGSPLLEIKTQPSVAAKINSNAGLDLQYGGVSKISITGSVNFGNSANLIMGTNEIFGSKATFTTGVFFGYNKWSFEPSVGNSLVLKYNGVTKFQFLSDGSIYAAGTINGNHTF